MDHNRFLKAKHRLSNNRIISFDNAKNLRFFATENLFRLTKAF